MKMVVLKAYNGPMKHAIVAEGYRVQDGFVRVRGNIDTTHSLKHKVDGTFGEKGVKIEPPLISFEVPVSNVAMIVDLPSNLAD